MGDFFTGSARRGPRVALGGRSRSAESRQQILERNRRERERRSRERERACAARRVQSWWRGICARGAAREAVRREWEAAYGRRGEGADAADASAGQGAMLREALFFVRADSAEDASTLARCAALGVLPAFAGAAAGHTLPLMEHAPDHAVARRRAGAMLCAALGVLAAAGGRGGTEAQTLLAPLADPSAATHGALPILATAAAVLADAAASSQLGAQPHLDRLMALARPPCGAVAMPAALAALLRLQSSSADADGAAAAMSGDCLAARVITSVCGRYAETTTRELGAAAAAAFATASGPLCVPAAPARYTVAAEAVSQALLTAAERAPPQTWDALEPPEATVALANLAEALTRAPGALDAARARRVARCLCTLLHTARQATASVKVDAAGTSPSPMEVDEDAEQGAGPWGLPTGGDARVGAQLELLATSEALAPLVRGAGGGAEHAVALCELLGALFESAGSLAPRLVSTLAYRVGLLGVLWRDVLRSVPSDIDWAAAALGRGRGAQWLPPLVAFCEVTARTLASADADELRAPAAGKMSSAHAVPATAMYDPSDGSGVVAIARKAAWDMLWAPILQTPPPRAAAARDAVCKFLRVAFDRLTTLELAPPSAFHAAVLSSDAGLERFRVEVEAALSGTGADAFEQAAAAQHQVEGEGAETAAPAADNGDGGGRASNSGTRVRGLLLAAPCLVPFSARAEAFHSLVSTDRDENRGRSNMFGHVMGRLIKVRRGKLLEDGMQALNELGGAVKGLIRVQFVDVWDEAEDGIDGGGLFKDFLEELLKEGFSDKLGLFRPNARNELYPDPAAGCSARVLQLYEFLGCMVGKAVYEGILLELPLAQHFLRKVLPGRLGQAGAADLASLDAELDANLRYVKRAGVAAADLGLTLAATTAGGREVGLLPGGRGAQVPVTEANAALYVHLMAHFRLNAETRAASAAFAEGFHCLIAPEWVSLFTPRELQELVSGRAGKIDVDDMRAHTLYQGGFHEDHPVVHTFWEVMASLSAREQRLMVKFVTSCSRAPLMGFSALQPNFCLSMAGHVGDKSNAERLPTAATCMNLLKMPPYDSKELMKEKFLQAISLGGGFYLS